MHNAAHPGTLIADLIGSRTVTEVARHSTLPRHFIQNYQRPYRRLRRHGLTLEEAFGIKADLWLRL